MKKEYNILKMHILKKIFSSSSGQSLMEVLVSVGVAAILIGGAVTAISLALRQDMETRAVQAANSLAEGLINDVRETANSNWHAIYDLLKGSGNKYFIAISGGTSTVVSGEESIVENAPTNGLVGHWKMDELTGTTVFDFSSIYNNGLFSGSPTRKTSSNCIAGGCLELTGVNYVNIPYNSALNLQTNVTYSHWVKITTAIPASNWPISLGNNNSHIYYAFRSLSNGTNWMFEYGRDNPTCGGATYGSTGTLALGLNTWHHLAMTYDGTSIKVYFDGVLVHNVNFTGGFCNNTNSTFRIGSAASTGYFSVDDARVYNRALSSDEVLKIYRSRVFTRSFYSDNVNRNVSGNISDAGTDDPSTQKITANISWPVGRSISKSEYITRSRNKVFNQANWSGGSGQSGVVTEPNNKYDVATGVTITDSGTIKIELP